MTFGNACVGVPVRFRADRAHDVRVFDKLRYASLLSRARPQSPFAVAFYASGLLFIAVVFCVRFSSCRARSDFRVTVVTTPKNLTDVCLGAFFFFFFSSDPRPNHPSVEQTFADRALLYQHGFSCVKLRRLRFLWTERGEKKKT